MNTHERSPIENDARKAARGRRIAGSACALCGLTDPDVLVAVDRTLLEFHHVAGVANDPAAGAWLCRNCHALVTEAQRDFGVDLRHDEDRASLERLEAALRSLASFFVLLADRLVAWADSVSEHMASDDGPRPRDER